MSIPPSLRRAGVNRLGGGDSQRPDGAGYRELRQLALDEDTTLQSLANEALNDLLKKRGAKPVVA